MRRWREWYEEHGYDGLMDRRRGVPSSKRLASEHQIGLSYTWVKQALQDGGLVKRAAKRGVHRKQRERRPLPEMMLHIDGSRHHWFQDEGCGTCCPNAQNPRKTHFLRDLARNAIAVSPSESDCTAAATGSARAKAAMTR